MTANPSSGTHGDPLITVEQSTYSVQGSNGGNTDLFCASEGVSAARRSCAAIAVAYESQVEKDYPHSRGASTWTSRMHIDGTSLQVYP